jgi:hypothetical protein
LTTLRHVTTTWANGNKLIFTELINSYQTKEEKTEKSILAECRRLFVAANRVPKIFFVAANRVPKI